MGLSTGGVGKRVGSQAAVVGQKVENQLVLCICECGQRSADNVEGPHQVTGAKVNCHGGEGGEGSEIVKGK